MGHNVSNRKRLSASTARRILGGSPPPVFLILIDAHSGPDRRAATWATRESWSRVIGRSATSAVASTGGSWWPHWLAAGIDDETLVTMVGAPDLTDKAQLAQFAKYACSDSLPAYRPSVWQARLGGHTNSAGPVPAAKHWFGNVIAPGIAGLDVAQGGVDGSMPRLAHQIDQWQLQITGCGEQAASERMSGEFLRIQPGQDAGLLHQPGNDFVRHFSPHQPAGAGNAAKERFFHLPGRRGVRGRRSLHRR